MESLLEDLRYALRALRKNPGFTAVAVATLALGIGADTAIFSVVNGVLLRPLPYQEPERLVMVWNTHDEGRLDLSEQELLAYREQEALFRDVGAFGFGAANLTGEGEAERLRAAAVDARVLPVLGVEPALGRAFTPAEDAPGNEPVALLEHGLWERRFGADPGVVGRRIRLDGDPTTVVGVLPEGFRLPLDFTGEPARVLVPLALEATPDPRNLHYLHAIARLAPGVGAEAARGGLAPVAARLKERLGTLPATFSATVVPVREQVVGDVRPALLLLLGAVGLVLLIACVNVANLLLARGDARGRELAVRTALGAGRARLARQVLTECLALAALGGVLGAAAGVWGTEALLALAPPGVPRLDAVRVDARVLGFAAAVTLGTGLLFGSVPALRAMRGSPFDRLREGNRGGGGGRQHARRGLVAAEIALATALTIGAGLLARSFLALRAEDPGFRAERVLTFRLSPPESRYPDAPATRAFYDRLLERVRSTPGVGEAGAATNLPLAADPGDWGVHIEGRTYEGPEDSPNPDWHVVTPDWFDALGIPILVGRPFRPADRADAPQTVVVNEAFAAGQWPAGSPVGARLRLTTDIDTLWRTVVGVVGNVRHGDLGEAPRPAIYLPHAQFPSTSEFVMRSMSVAARTSAEPAALAGPLREAVRDLDPEVPVTSLASMEEVREAATAVERFQGTLFGAFAAIALVLVVVGIYGVTAYLVGRRTRELGLRIALGATPGDLLRLVLREGLALAAVGVAAGIAGALALSRLLSGLLYGVGAADPLTFAVVPALLAATALAATAVPARRAALVEPMRALREE